MKSIIVVLGAIVFLCSAQTRTEQVRYADKDLLEKQKFLFDILQHVHQDDILVQKFGEHKNYKIQDNLDSYHKPEMVKEFIDFYLEHDVPVEEYFTPFDEYHRIYAKGLTRAMYLAKDFETYKKTVIWARFHMVKPLFVYALHIATLARPDMQGIVLPAIYEIIPHHFFTAETIQKAQLRKMQGFQGLKKIEDVYTMAIPSNYTGKYGHFCHEKLLTYFTEDVGLNAFYYYFNIDYPYWTKGRPEAPLINDRRGSLYIYLHWQILARYYMERLSHNMDDIEEFNWNVDLDPGYESGLRYYNGIHFPTRPDKFDYYNSENYRSIDLAELYEERIMESIDMGRVILKDMTMKKLESVPEAVEILGNMLQGNEDSVNTKYYGSLEQEMRFVINNGVPYGTYEHILPGTLMNYETSLRDPAFYKMAKRIMKNYWRYMEHVPPYTKQELEFEGVKITEIEVDKMITYFDKFDSDITNAVDVEPHTEAVSTEMGKFGWLSQYQGHDFVIKARQHRLNHMPFTIKMTVNSNKAQKATVRIFLGPKYDAHHNKIGLKINRQNFMELDQYVVDLVAGNNVLSRSSDDMWWYVNDRTTNMELYKKMMTATNSDKYKFPLDMSEAHCGFPNRLMLPRGKKGGMPFQILVVIRPYREPKTPQFTGYDPVVSCGIGSGARFVDDTPYGYPLDREIDPSNFKVDNIKLHDVMIHHKTEGEVNALHH